MSTLTAGFVSYIRSTIHQLQPASSFATWSACTAVSAIRDPGLGVFKLIKSIYTNNDSDNHKPHSLPVQVWSL